jgi:TonB-dependent receptor
MLDHLYKGGRWLVCAAGFLACSPTLWPAALSGRVYDEINNLYLESARVSVQGTERAAVSGRGGAYRITDLEPGEYTVVATATGRPAVTQRVVIENAYDEVTLNLTFSEEQVFELEALVVEGTAIGTAKGMDIRRTAKEFREVLASDAFGQFVDRNPAEALSRVAGITTETDQGEGSFLIIRGGAPELSNVQIDGIGLATPQEDGRRINLNVITVDQLERIEVSKTWLPSQKANVIGGTVNMITRSALDRGERFASIEGAVTYREIDDQELSYRGAVTFGDIIDQRDFDFMREAALGVQFSVNYSKDFSGSDTVSWVWETDKNWPFLTRPGESDTRPRGYTLEEVNLRNFNITRERLGSSGRIEFRLNENHEVFASISHNQFDDTEREHTFAMISQDLAQFYSGTMFLTTAIMEQLGLDPDDAFNKQRLALGPPNAAAALTYNEAIALGELGYDPDLKIFSRGGLWGLPMNRTFIHTLREEQIDTVQLGGRHKLPWEIAIDWKAFVSEASQDSEENWLRFSVDGSTGLGGVPIAGKGVENPYILDQSENPVLFRKSSFFVQESSGGGSHRQLNFTESADERKGYDINLEKALETGSATWTTQLGASVESRDKGYKVNRNTYGLLPDSLDPERWANRRMSLADEFFDGGEIEGFEDNFGPNLPFGPSFNEENTLAFLKDPGAYGATFSQNENHINNNVTSRVNSNYEATEDIFGYYLQQSVAWREWTLIFGARYEETDNSFTNIEILTKNPDFPQLRFISPSQWKLLSDNFGEIFSSEVTRERSYDHLLPAVHLVRRIGDNLAVRASVTETIARPLFSDLIPREIPSISGGQFQPSIRLPAFDLMPMESTNYDISFDYYFEPIGVLSVAVFHKDLDGPIYDEVRTGVGPNEETEFYELKYNSRNANWKPGDPVNNVNSYTFRQKKNSGKGELRGIEVTFDRRLNFLPRFWNGFGINSNIAFFDSEATLLTDNRLGEVVPLFKQPDITANLSLYYEKHGLFARLSYNIRGKYLDSIQAGQTIIKNIEDIGDPLNAADVYVARTDRLDFTLRYKVTPSFQVFLEAINLTNEPVTRYMGNSSRPLSRQYTERVFTLGVKWNL